MSIMDSKLVLDDGVAITTTRDSTNVLKLSGTAGVNKGKGTPVYLHVRVNTAFTASGAGTLTVAVATADTSACGTVIYQTPALAKTALVKGYEIISMALPSSVLASFLKVTYTVGTGPMTAGAVDAWLDLDDAKAN